MDRKMENNRYYQSRKYEHLDSRMFVSSSHNQADQRYIDRDFFEDDVLGTGERNFPDDKYGHNDISWIYIEEAVSHYRNPFIRFIYSFFCSFRKRTLQILSCLFYHQKVRIISILTIFSLFFCLTTSNFASADSRITVVFSVDGVQQTISTWDPTIKGIVSASGYNVAVRDSFYIDGEKVSYSSALMAENNSTVEIQASRILSITSNDIVTSVLSSAQDVNTLIEDANEDYPGSEISVTSLKNSDALNLYLYDDTLKVNILYESSAEIYEQILYSNRKDTVYSLLKSNGIEIDDDDIISIVRNNEDLLEVSIRVVSGQLVLETTEIVYETKQVETDDLFIGESRELSLGEYGILETTSEVFTEGSEIISSEIVSQVVVQEPIDKVVEVGTREVTAANLVAAGIDPASDITTTVSDTGLTSVLYSDTLGTVSSLTQIAEAAGITESESSKLVAEANPTTGNTSTTSTNSTTNDLSAYEGYTSPSEAQAIAKTMISAYGWGDDQFECLVSLWNRESGWNMYASNSYSGAYGIPQALPGSKMATAGADWQTNAATQIKWGLSYISGRYSTPCGAWSAFQSKGWY